MSAVGKLNGISAADYHAADAISHSKLEVFRRRPALFRKTYIDKTIAREETRAMVVGQALHCRVLEPSQYDLRFVRKPDGIDRRTTDGKVKWQAFVRDNAGKGVLDGDEFAQVDAMRDAVLDHPLAFQLLTTPGGVAEVTWRAQSKALPHPLQCRTDWFNPAGCELSEGRPYAVDVKTVDSLDADEYRNFGRAFWSLGYHRQCGFYLPLMQDCGTTCWDWFFVVVEKQEPFGCVVYRPNADAVSRGIDETITDLERLAKAYRTDRWDNMPTDVQEIGLPSWYGKDAA